MKKTILASALVLLFGGSALAQSEPVPDQNPNYALSRDRYMAMADSINQWHGTTSQQTYKAFDWYEARMERREERRQFRRQLRLERARWNGGWNNCCNTGWNSRFGMRYFPNNSPWGFWWW